MKVTYDPWKRDKTWEERRLDFERVPEIFTGLHYTQDDTRKDYGEVLRITAGYLDQRLVVAVWTPRGKNIHVISLRKANAKERKRLKDRLG